MHGNPIHPDPPGDPVQWLVLVGVALGWALVSGLALAVCVVLVTMRRRLR